MVDITHIFWLYLGTYNSNQNRKTRLVPTGWETCDQPALCDQISYLPASSCQWNIYKKSRDSRKNPVDNLFT